MLVIISCVLFRCNFNVPDSRRYWRSLKQLFVSLSLSPFLFLSYMTKGDNRSLTSVQRVPINLIFTTRNNTILANYIIVFSPHEDKASALFLFICFINLLTCTLITLYSILNCLICVLRLPSPSLFAYSSYGTSD